MRRSSTPVALMKAASWLYTMFLGTAATTPLIIIFPQKILLLESTRRSTVSVFSASDRYFLDSLHTHSLNEFLRSTLLRRDVLLQSVYAEICTKHLRPNDRNGDNR